MLYAPSLAVYGECGAYEAGGGMREIIVELIASVVAGAAAGTFAARIVVRRSNAGRDLVGGGQSIPGSQSSTVFGSGNASGRDINVNQPPRS